MTQIYTRTHSRRYSVAQAEPNPDNPMNQLEQMMGGSKSGKIAQKHRR